MTLANDAVQIQPATLQDIPVILELIHELAEFEHLRDQVTATAAQLQEHLFGARPYAQVLLARDAMQVVGFALFFHSYSTFLTKPGIYLEDLYVRETWRGHGVGTRLLQAVQAEAVARGCGRYEWSVLNWNRRAIDFYEKMGARPLSEWTVYRLSGAALYGQTDAD